MAGDGKEVERSIAFFCNACETALPTGRLELSNLLTKLLGCINTINSSLESQQTTSSVSPSPNLVIQSCQRFEELVKKLPSIQLKLISNVTLLCDSDAKLYGHILQLTYQCFRTLKVNKLLKVELDYFYILLRQTLDCLSVISHEEMKPPIIILLLLRISYACLVGLPISTVNVSDAACTLSSYFRQKDVNIQVSAYNSAQFLIPVIKKSDLVLFILSPTNVSNILSISGKSIPVTSTLNLILSYGKLPENHSVLLQGGTLLYATAILFHSSNSVEKQLAFSIVQMLSSNHVLLRMNDSSCVSAKITSEAGTTSELQKITAKLSKEIHLFTSTCVKENSGDGKQHTTTIKVLLKELGNNVRLYCSQSTEAKLPDEAKMLDVATMLLNSIVILLEALQLFNNDLYVMWLNSLIYDSWELAKDIARHLKYSVTESLLLSFVDAVLAAIASAEKKAQGSKVVSNSLSLCFDVLGDFLFDTILDAVLPVDTIRECLLGLNFSLFHPSLQFQCKLLICSLLDTNDSTTLIELSIDKKSLIEFVDHLQSCNTIQELEVELKKAKALTKIPANCFLLKQSEILLILEVLIAERFTGTIIEDLSAELICTLLSDQHEDNVLQKDENFSLASFEKFMAACFNDVDISESHMKGIEETIRKSIDSVPGTDQVSQAIAHHARCLFQVMSLSNGEFERVFNSSDCTDIKYLVNCAKLLKELCALYQEANDGARAVFEKQFVHLSQQYLPKISSVAFRSLKVLKDNNPESWPALDREMYFTSLMNYLFNLHSAIEEWSRMDYSVQLSLVNNGAFYLLLNELHTAPSAKIITEDMIYLILTSLYNVLLDSKLARRFRIILTKKLLDYFIGSSDLGIRFLAIFCKSCLHVVMSQSEINELSLQPVEVGMILQCLNGVQNFFGGQKELILTITNLSKSPLVRKVFIDGGVFDTLKAQVVESDPMKSSPFLTALLNFIDEPELFQIQQPSNDPIKTRMTSDPSFVSLILDSESNASKVLQLLLFPPNDSVNIDNIEVLYGMKRYRDCFASCEQFLKSHQDTDSVLTIRKCKLYKAKSMYYDYQCDLLKKIESSDAMPSFEHLEAMKAFCKNQIVPVIKILAFLCNEESSHGDSTEHLLMHSDDELHNMLDKALLDILVYNKSNQVSICLLCHKKAKKQLVHSHYIPKSILVEFVKVMGLEPGARVFLSANNWQYRSAGQATFSMLCRHCDGVILSEDEKLFKEKFFCLVYDLPMKSNIHMLAHSLAYGQYLYKFAAGLFFRNAAPLYSGIYAEIGDVLDLQALMESCRKTIFNLPCTSEQSKFYLLFLPLKLPPEVPQLAGWDKFAVMNCSQYGAYKLLRPGEPNLPKTLYCFMVKIGVLVFLVSLDLDLDKDLLATCPECQILNGDGVFNIPDNENRLHCIPRKLWWSLVGWAKLEINQSLSALSVIKPPVEISDRPPAGYLILSDVIHSEKASPVTANLLPPGFELNFERKNVHPDKVIVVPDNHDVLLHYAFKTTSGSQGYAILGRKKQVNDASNSKGIKKPVYSVIASPYILLFVEDAKKKLSLKTGFMIDEATLAVTGTLPGIPKDSLEIKDFIDTIPEIISSLLCGKGFRSLKSLLFWQDVLDNISRNRTEDEKKTVRKTCFCLDTRCLNNRCVYCDTRCDVCLLSPHDHFKRMEFSNLGDICCCSEGCSLSLFTESKHDMQVNYTDTVLDSRHKVKMEGHFTVEDVQHSGLKTAVMFLVLEVPQPVHDRSTMSVMVWYRNITKPLCFEYEIDEDFNAVCPVRQSCATTYGERQEWEMMEQLHLMLVRMNVPSYFLLGSSC